MKNFCLGPVYIVGNNMEGTSVKIEKLIDHDFPGDVSEEGGSAVAQLVQVVAALCQQQANSRQTQSMVWSCPCTS